MFVYVVCVYCLSWFLLVFKCVLLDVFPIEFVTYGGAGVFVMLCFLFDCFMMLVVLICCVGNSVVVASYFLCFFKFYCDFGLLCYCCDLMRMYTFWI